MLLKSYAKDLLDELNRRFGEVLDDDLYTFAAFLNPNQKLNWCDKFFGPNRKEHVKAMVLENIK